MRTLSAILALLVVLAAPSCFISRSAINEPLERTAIARLVPGQTTAAEAVALLGAPSDVIQLGHRSAYRYDSSLQKRAGFTVIVVTFLNEDTRTDRLWLFFDEKDVLTHAGSTLQSADTRYAMPWQEIHGG